MFHQLHARLHRLPAHLTSEDDWKHDQPGVRLSRVFGVVLGIHVIAIGGLMAYEMLRHREQPNANTAALRPAPREPRPSGGSPAAHARTADKFADDPVHDGMRKHVVAPGERLGHIAARYGVDEKALMTVNRLGDGRGFQSGMKLVIPNQQLQAAPPLPPDRLLAAQTASVADTLLEPAASGNAGDAAAAADMPPIDPNVPIKRALPVDERVAATPRAAATPSNRPAGPAAKPAPAVAQTNKKSATPPATASRKTGAAAPAPVAAKKQETASAKPKPKPTGRVHVVKEGETAYGIAKKHGVNLDQLIKTNGINPSVLRPGTALTIPAAR